MAVQFVASQQQLPAQGSNPGGSYGRALLATQIGGGGPSGSFPQPPVSQQQQSFNNNYNQQGPVINSQDMKYPVGNSGQAAASQQQRPVSLESYGPLNLSEAPVHFPRSGSGQVPPGINNFNSKNLPAGPQFVDFSKPNNARCECYIATLTSNDTTDLMDLLLPFGTSRSITTERTDITCRELKTQCMQHCRIQRESCLASDLGTTLPGQDPPLSYGSYACKTLPTVEEIRKPAAIFYALNAMYCKDEGFISRLNDYYCCLNFRHPFVQGENLRLFSPNCIETMASEYCGGEPNEGNGLNSTSQSGLVTDGFEEPVTGTTEEPIVVRPTNGSDPAPPNFNSSSAGQSSNNNNNNTGEETNGGNNLQGADNNGAVSPVPFNNGNQDVTNQGTGQPFNNGNQNSNNQGTPAPFNSGNQNSNSQGTATPNIQNELPTTAPQNGSLNSENGTPTNPQITEDYDTPSGGGSSPAVTENGLQRAFGNVTLTPGGPNVTVPLVVPTSTIRPVPLNVTNASGATTNTAQTRNTTSSSGLTTARVVPLSTNTNSSAG
ncbi:hypothetical protein BV898_02198 [Hypsibius exemplaris]|uniref:Uncharacterized protein n=1 Tax=Hypsibius exemplaris TaxID=2072580 RepID=A0A1W0X8X8_HYPEX|nr:hypothetical protein BV898_02198 [Hypsibius exemplaris]